HLDLPARRLAAKPDNDRAIVVFAWDGMSTDGGVREQETSGQEQRTCDPERDRRVGTAALHGCLGWIHQRASIGRAVASKRKSRMKIKIRTRIKSKMKIKRRTPDSQSYS